MYEDWCHGSAKISMQSQRSDIFWCDEDQCHGSAKISVHEKINMKLKERDIYILKYYPPKLLDNHYNQ
jgi:hypothetical protein